MLYIFLFPIIMWAIIAIGLRNDKSSAIIPVSAERGNNITQTSILHKDLSQIQYRVLTSKFFLRFAVTILYEWLRSLTNVFRFLPRAILYMAFIYCIYDPLIITKINLTTVQIVFEALSKNTESIISLIIALSVLELFCREGFYTLSSKPVRDIDDYRKTLIRQHLNLPSDAKIIIQRGKRKLAEGK